MNNRLCDLIRNQVTLLLIVVIVVSLSGCGATARKKAVNTTAGTTVTEEIYSDTEIATKEKAKLPNEQLATTTQTTSTETINDPKPTSPSPVTSVSKPVITIPASGTIVDSGKAFKLSWTRVSGAIYYEVWVRNITTNGSLFRRVHDWDPTEASMSLGGSDGEEWEILVKAKLPKDVWSNSIRVKLRGNSPPTIPPATIPENIEWKGISYPRTRVVLKVDKKNDTLSWEGTGNASVSWAPIAEVKKWRITIQGVYLGRAFTQDLGPVTTFTLPKNIDLSDGATYILGIDAIFDNGATLGSQINFTAKIVQ